VLIFSGFITLCLNYLHISIIIYNVNTYMNIFIYLYSVIYICVYISLFCLLYINCVNMLCSPLAEENKVSIYLSGSLYDIFMNLFVNKILENGIRSSNRMKK